jgi:pteridine reductase
MAEEVRALGVPVYPFAADLTDEAALQSLFSSLDAIPHYLKVLVNSAAVMPRGDVRTLSHEEWNSTLALNLTAPLLCAQQAAQRMTAGGMILNVTDTGAGRAWTGFPAYMVSKAALESLTRVLAKAYAPLVRVNAIAPGLVMPSENISLEDWNRLVSRLPLKRPASEDEISAALEFLLKNEYVTGQTIVVDGGYSLI